MASTTGQETGTPGTDQNAVAQINAEQAEATTNVIRHAPEDSATGGINPNTAQAKLRESGIAEAADAGSGFTFTPEEVEFQLAQCTEQLAELRFDREDAQWAEAAVRPPAPDQASTSQATAVRDMLTSTVAVIDSNIAYLTSWRDKLQQAKNNYLTSDHVSAEQWTQQAGALQA